MHLRAMTEEDHGIFEQATSVPVGPDMTGIVASTDADPYVAICGFNMWTPSSVTMHIWIKDTVALKEGLFLRECFRYAFGICDRRMVVVTIPEDNEACMRFTEWIGFKEIGRVPDGWDEGVDLVCKQVLRSECQWFEEN